MSLSLNTPKSRIACRISLLCLWELANPGPDTAVNQDIAEFLEVVLAVTKVYLDPEQKKLFRGVVEALRLNELSHIFPADDTDETKRVDDSKIKQFVEDAAKLSTRDAEKLFRAWAQRRSPATAQVLNTAADLMRLRRECGGSAIEHVARVISGTSGEHTPPATTLPDSTVRKT